MPVKHESCAHIDWSPTVPDPNGETDVPFCRKGRQFSALCIMENNCLDYEPTVTYGLEEAS